MTPPSKKKNLSVKFSLKIKNLRTNPKVSVMKGVIDRSSKPSYPQCDAFLTFAGPRGEVQVVLLSTALILTLPEEQDLLRVSTRCAGPCRLTGQALPVTRCKGKRHIIQCPQAELVHMWISLPFLKYLCHFIDYMYS